MQKIGIESAILFIAALASFLFGAFVPAWSKVAMTFCAIFFVIACVILALTIMKRGKTKIG